MAVSPLARSYSRLQRGSHPSLIFSIFWNIFSEYCEKRCQREKDFPSSLNALLLFLHQTPSLLFLLLHLHLLFQLLPISQNSPVPELSLQHLRLNSLSNLLLPPHPLAAQFLQQELANPPHLDSFLLLQNPSHLLSFLVPLHPLLSNLQQEQEQEWLLVEASRAPLPQSHCLNQ